MLTLEAVSAGYGPTQALRELSLTVSRGELVCLLGANGAGKSTALKTISGLVRPSRGRVVFDGEEIGGLGPPEIGRALMSRPRLVLFDEPSLGLAPAAVEATFGVIRGVRAQGTTVLMVEQNAYGALRMADRAYVLETGRVALAGPARDLLDDAHVRRAYLGG